MASPSGWPQHYGRRRRPRTLSPQSSSASASWSPGSVDPQAGTVANVGNLPGWQEPFALAAALTSGLGVPVRLGNDVGVAVEAEAALGAGRRYGSFLGLWW